MDNLGDIGVAWRLARCLAADRGDTVRLWVDDLGSFRHLWPSVQPELSRQFLAGVDIRLWPQAFPDEIPGEIVIELFGCPLPEPFLQRMALVQPLWINLEYLSAEDWVAGCHGLPSPHPRLPLVQHFFFPGFAPGTGGVLAGPDLKGRRKAFVAARRPLPARHKALAISLFAYDNPAIDSLLPLWASGSEAIHLLVAPGSAARRVAQFMDGDTPDFIHRRGMLSARFLPWLDQDDYDRLLWSCDLNFVRGEDSFVRAQWAAVPFIWQIYHQEARAHIPKLDAFLHRFLAEAPESLAAPTADFCRAWNGEGDAAKAWPAFRATLVEPNSHLLAWKAQLKTLGDLAENLARFTASQLK